MGRSLWFRWAGAAMFLASFLVLSLVGGSGCASKTPTAASFVATSTPTLPSNFIDNLEDGDAYLNPTFCGVKRTGVPEGFWVASSWGDPSNVINGGPGKPFVFSGAVGANGTDSAIHIYGQVTDHADGQYPAFQLQGKLQGGEYYDTVPYGLVGVRFYYKTGVDTCPTRRFNLPIAATTESSGGGTCMNKCYDHFGAPLTPTSGAWSMKAYYFNAALGTPFLSRKGFGSAISPATLSGAHLSQVLEVQWLFGRDGAAGESSVDYWIDEVEFF